MMAFVFIHGRWETRLALSYLISGLLYGGVFILLGRRRLEWLITAHILYDSLFIFAPLAFSRLSRRTPIAPADGESPRQSVFGLSDPPPLSFALGLAGAEKN